jgi:hypothetical protein
METFYVAHKTLDKQCNLANIDILHRFSIVANLYIV